MWESRVLRRAFERLELHEGKLSRAVLRGGGGGDVTSLPDAGVGNHPGLPGPDYAPDTGLRPSIEELERRKAWMLQNGNCKGPGPAPAAEKDAEKLRRPGQSTSRVECGETWMNPP